MKKNFESLVAHMVLLGTLLTLAACQEKVSPQLTEAAASGGGTATGGGGGGGGGGASTPTYNFQVALKDPAASLLGMSLHPQGESASTPCRVEDLSGTAPATLAADEDITCHLDSEEMALFYNGFTFQVSADADTCPYIGYEPYSFWQWRPGISGRQDRSARIMLKVECDDEVVSNFSATAFDNTLAGWGANNSAAFPTLAEACNKIFNIDGAAAGVTDSWGSLDLSATTTVAYDSDTDPQDMCTFDYRDEGGPNCDSGGMIIHTLTLASVDDDADPMTPDVLEATQGSESSLECGGRARYCMGGPVRDLFSDSDFVEKGFSARYYLTNDEAHTEELTIPSSFSKGYYTNLSNASFTRQCSGVANFSTTGNFSTSSAAYNADVIGEYVTLGSQMLRTKDYFTPAPYSNVLDVLQLADDPFRGGIPTALATGNLAALDATGTTLRARPYYTFYCMDYSMDVKARIRVAVREWNRSPTAALIPFVSDIHADTGAAVNPARMDASGAQNLPWGGQVDYNDLVDWDDFLLFDDSGGASCSASAMVPYGSYLEPDDEGWFPKSEL